MAEQNLALDEALLDEAESDPTLANAELLRLWSPTAFCVVLGRHSAVDEEVDRDFCERRKIPIARRMSGGATVLIGPGCLMYSLLLSYELHPELRDLSLVHKFVLERLSLAVSGSSLRGTSDLALGDRKVSGNSLRCKRNHLLYHGTILYDFPLDLISSALRMPPRVPAYRAGRTHDDFVTNCQASEAELRRLVIEAWQAKTLRATWPQERVDQLVAERYGDNAWTFSR